MSRLNERGRVRGASVLAALLFGLSALATAAESPDPGAAAAARAVVEQTVGEVVAVLANKDWSVDKRIDEIEKIAYRTFDFPTISRLVLARSYRKFSSDQKQSFEREFRHHLSHSYGSRVDRYHQEQIDIVGTRVEKRGDVTVRTRIVGGPADGIEIHYRLRESEGAWRMIDVVIEGVSLISSYRSQFKEVLGSGGPVELLRRLHERNTPLEGDVDGKNGGLSSPLKNSRLRRARAFGPMPALRKLAGGPLRLHFRALASGQIHAPGSTGVLQWTAS